MTDPFLYVRIGIGKGPVPKQPSCTFGISSGEPLPVRSKGFLSEQELRLAFGMSITLDVDEGALRALPLGPGERERHMQIELACRYYAKRWQSFGLGARMAGLDHFAFACELAERDIPRDYTLEAALEDVAHAGRQ